MNQKELQEFHNLEVDVLRVFSVMTASHLNKDGVSRIRFAIANNNGDALRFLDNGEILQKVAKTEKGKKCFQYPPNKFKPYYYHDIGYYILAGEFITHRLFKKHYKISHSYLNEKSNTEEVPIKMQSIEYLLNLPYNTVDGDGEKRRCEHDRRYTESVYKDNFNNQNLKSELVVNVYETVEKAFNEKPMNERLKIKIETLLALQNQIDKAIEDSKALEMQSEQVQACKAAEKAKQAKLQEKIKKEELKKREEAKKQDPFYDFE